MLYAENVYVRFGGLTAVDNVSLHIKPGEIHAIIGPNGAGKSTFFNAISGINAPSEGKISFLGQDITGMSQYQVAAKGIGRTFQNIKLFNSMTVLENVICGCHMNVKSNMFQDMLGMFSDYVPKFVKHFADCGEIMKQAFRDFDAEVKAGTFPEEKHCFKIDDEVIKKLY